MLKFGSWCGDGLISWGFFICVYEGVEVWVVVVGCVVFVDWLCGFGNFIIVDYGNQYMMIYGNNQLVLKCVGDLVKIGEIIVIVGNSGGNE